MSRVTVLIEHDDGHLTKVTGRYGGDHSVDPALGLVQVLADGLRTVTLTDPRTPEPTT